MRGKVLVGHPSGKGLRAAYQEEEDMKPNTARILVACEFSGVVRDAFAARGWDAWSCDLLPTESPGQHLQCDVRDVLADGWNMLIAHPPCTHLASSGARWFDGKGREQAEALEFVRAFLDAPVPHIALENPVGVISTAIRPPDQIIHPWQFGHREAKTTCLWLKNLVGIRPTKVLNCAAWVKCQCCDNYICTIHRCHVCDCACPAIEYWSVNPYLEGGRWDNQTPSGQNRLSPTADRWKERSRTYSGIATAMADQWTRPQPCMGSLFDLTEMRS